VNENGTQYLVRTTAATVGRMISLSAGDAPAQRARTKPSTNDGSPISFHAAITSYSTYDIVEVPTHGGRLGHGYILTTLVGRKVTVSVTRPAIVSQAYSTL
jgi:hypothetical protein